MTSWSAAPVRQRTLRLTTEPSSASASRSQRFPTEKESVWMAGGSVNSGFEKPWLWMLVMPVVPWMRFRRNGSRVVRQGEPAP